MTVLEQEPQPKYSLPEFHGTGEEIGAWLDTQDQATEAYATLQAGMSYGYESPLPTIVGYIPEEERDYFDKLPDFIDRTSGRAENGLLRYKLIDPEVLVGPNKWPKQLLGVEEVIEADLRSIGSITILNRQPDIELVVVKKGFSPRGDHSPHFDGSLNEGQQDFAYVASNRLGTQFYDGPVVLRSFFDDDNGKAYVDNRTIVRESLDTTRELVSPPNYAILRVPKLAIHVSPIAGEQTTRTFLRTFAI